MRAAQRQHPLPLEVFNAALQAYSSVGAYDKARAVYQRVLSQGLVPDDYTYAALLTASRRRGAHSCEKPCGAFALSNVRIKLRQDA